MGSNISVRMEEISLAVERPQVEPTSARLSDFAPQLRRAMGNAVVAALFFVSAWPNTRNFLNAGIADQVWVIGAFLMGALSLVRLPPRNARFQPRDFAATAAMFALPGLMRTAALSWGPVASLGIFLEIAGTALQQIARVWLGRSFGILPANRGVVAAGPFRLVRHPIYAGWLVANLGFALSYPSLRNFALTAAMVPFMIWRASLEEEVLLEDPEYADYARRVTYRVIPGVI